MTPEEIQRLLTTSNLSPEELQRLQGVFGQQANASSSAYGQNVIGQSSTNVQRQNVAQLGDNLQDIKERGGQMLGSAKDTLTTPGGVFKNKAGDFRRSGGGVSSAAFSGLGTLLSGDPLAAAISTPVGMAAGAVANPLVDMATQGMLKGPLPLKALAMGLRFAAPSFIGSGAQQIVANAVGGFKAKAGEAAASAGGPDISAGGIPLTEAARQRLQRERDVQAQVYSMNALGNASRVLDRQALAMGREDTDLRMKAAMPYIEKIKRDDLVNAQAKLASEGAMYQALGRQAGMFKLAQGAQAETGATMRTAISQNPYLGATLSAPSISFG